MGRILRRRRHQRRELARAFFEALVRERRVVRRDHVGAESFGAATRDDVADVQRRRRLAEVLPRLEGLAHTLVAGGQSAVADRHASESFRVLPHEAQTDQAAPVLAEERDVVKDQVIEEEFT